MLATEAQVGVPLPLKQQLISWCGFMVWVAEKRICLRKYKMQEDSPTRNTALLLYNIAPGMAQVLVRCTGWVSASPPTFVLSITSSVAPDLWQFLPSCFESKVTLTQRAKCTKPLCGNQRQPVLNSPSYQEHMVFFNQQVSRGHSFLHSGECH